MQLIKFLIIFKLHFKQKKIMFKILYVKKLIKIIKIFIKFGLIQKIKMKNDHICIYFNLSKKKKFLTNIDLLYKSNNKKKIKLTTLHNMEATNLNTVYILLTSKGLLTNLDALKFHIGGIMLCRLS